MLPCMVGCIHKENEKPWENSSGDIFGLKLGKFLFFWVKSSPPRFLFLSHSCPPSPLPILYFFRKFSKWLLHWCGLIPARNNYWTRLTSCILLICFFVSTFVYLYIWIFVPTGVPITTKNENAQAINTTVSVLFYHQNIIFHRLNLG